MTTGKLMKAAVLHAKNRLIYEDYPLPEVGPGLVKIHVRSAGICGSDIPRVLGDSAYFYPIVLGHEFSGDVVEIGQEVTSVKVGDTVSGAALLPCYECADCKKGDYGLCRNYSFAGSRRPGAFCDYIVLPEANAIPYNPVISYDEAALFEPCTVALHGIRRANYKGSNFVAIVGSGTIGVFATQWVRFLGGKNIVVFDIDEERLRLAQKMGATHVVNTAASDFLEKAQELTQGEGFEYVFDTAGQPETVKACFELAAGKATVCLIGYPSVPVTFSSDLWHKVNAKELQILGSQMSYSAPFPGEDWTLTARFLASGDIKCDSSMIFTRYNMKDAAKAFELFKIPGAVKGKILLLNE